jgi:hypothetical protein
VARFEQGNIAGYAINRVEGTSIYIRNLKPFTGGRDAYSEKVITSLDRQNGLAKARTFLFQRTIGKLLINPCKELSQATRAAITVTWRCQFVTYSLPAYMRVARVRVKGKYLFLDVVYRPLYIREGQK